jgi:ABC-2 type transport system ATP-binding protein
LRENKVEDTVVQIDQLKKSYQNTVALAGIDLEVRRGEIFGIVGPNGAGKTTTIDCMTGMRKPDSGKVRVLGLDPQRNGSELRQRIGLQQQESELPERIRVGEAIDLFGGLFKAEPSKDELLERVGLQGKTGSYFSSLSGGQKKRLFVALALVNDPELIMLDELTSGLDPVGRRTLWSLVNEFRSSSRTVVLSTHYMDEAQKLCDRVAIVNSGRIAALDTPGELIRKYCQGMRLRLVCGSDFNPAVALALDGVLGASMNGDECLMDLRGSEVVVPVIKALSDAGVNLGNLRTETPTLEDVFMVVSGKEHKNG